MSSPEVQEPLTWKSYVALITFFVVLVFVFHPVKIPVPFWRRLNPWFHFHLNVATSPLLGVAFLLATTTISFGNEVRTGILGFGDVQPWAIVILIFSLSYISVSLERSGLFGYVAYRVATLGGKSGRRLFVYLYILTALIAAVFSNDVVVLVLTPIILFFTRLIGTDALPYLIASFQVANTASMALVVGNPTNIVVAQAIGLNYLSYTAWMILPTVFAVTLTLVMLLAFFWNRIPAEIPNVLSTLDSDKHYKIHDRFDCWFGIFAILGALLSLLIVSFFAHVSVALLTAPWAFCVLLKDLIRDLVDRRHARKQDLSVQPTAPKNVVDLQTVDREMGDDLAKGSDEPTSKSEPARMDPVEDEPVAPDSELDKIATPKSSAWLQKLEQSLPRTYTTLARLPWAVAPFCLSLFVLVEALNAVGWTSRVAWLFSFLCPNRTAALFSVGFISALAANLLNNLPMTVFAVRTIESPFFLQFATAATAPAIKSAAYWGLVVGSNISGNLTPVGALAGLIWLGVLERFEQSMSWLSFIKWGAIVLPFAVAVACGVLAIELLVMG